MTKLKTWLGGLLAVQLVLVVALFVSGQRSADFDQEKPLLTVDLEQVDKIVIYPQEGESLDLIKDDALWRLPDYGDLPASAQRVDEMLEKIKAAKTAWPIASSASSQKRFEVSDDNYQRKIVLYKEAEPVATFYLGTSPGYRSVHLRREGEGDVFSVKLATHEFPVENQDWFDKTVLDVSAVEGLSFADFAIKKAEDTWQLADASVAQTPQALDQEAVSELVSLFTSLSVQALAQDVTLSSPTVVRINAKGGDYAFSFAAVEDDYYVSRSDIDKVFRITKSDFEKLESASVASLIKASSEEDKTELGADMEADSSAQTVMEAPAKSKASGS